jgi:hypothetical protein
MGIDGELDEFTLPCGPVDDIDLPAASIKESDETAHLTTIARLYRA